MNHISSINLFQSAAPETKAMEQRTLLTVIDNADAVPDIGMLLPERNYNKALLDALCAMPRKKLSRSSFVGLFLADPFLNLGSALDVLKQCGIKGIANFPSTSFYGKTFATQLDSVALGRHQEFVCLGQAHKAGFDVLGCVDAEIDAEFFTQIDHSVAFIDRWLVHAGLHTTLKGSAPPRVFGQALDFLQGEQYSYAPYVTVSNLPASFSGYAVADWW